MSIEIEVVDTTETPTAIVSGESVPASKLPEFYDHAFNAVFAAIESVGLKPSGPAYGLYTAMGEGDDPHFDLEVGVPIGSAIDGAIDVPGHETVFASELPAGRAAKYRHVGSYDGLGQAWAEFMSALAERGLAAGQPRWEVYVTEPTPVANPAEMITELYCILR